MFNQMFNPKSGENILNQLQHIVQSSQLNGKELPLTVYSKGIVVSGYAISFSAYKLRSIEEAMKRQTELKEHLLALSAKYNKDLEQNVDAEIIVIRDAQVHYGSSSHRTSYWIGNISSIDAYEEKISGER